MAANSHTRVPPPAWFAGAWALQRLAAGRRTPTALSRLVFTVVAGASALLGAAAIITMKEKRTTLNPEQPAKASSLVTSGPFAATRNPIYLALAGLLVAHAISHRSLLAFAPVAGFIAVLNRGQIAAEEHALKARFGKQWTRYERSTPRWVGPATR